MAQEITTISSSLNSIINTQIKNQALLNVMMNAQAEIIAKIYDRDKDSVKEEFNSLVDENIKLIECDMSKLLFRAEDLW